ncbi:tRNA-uridine aminocarboxypropyltransferase 2-like [Homarus americanus]
MEDVEVELALLADLTHIEIGRREKRPLCNRCSRPVGVCWCWSLGRQRVNTSCRVVVLQHPHEEKRCLRTAPILQTALPKGAYVEIKGKRFSFARFPQLEDIFNSENSILMYPGEKAISLEELPCVGEGQAPYNIIIIDGTWQQAKSMYHNCRQLHNLRQVSLSGKYISEYVIRTQPTEDALSTVESAAIALATLEQNWSIYNTLVYPLQLLCQYQIKHGAVPHQSKEHMIVSGRCNKPLGKRTYKKLRKCGAKQGDTLSEFMDSLTLYGNQGEEMNDDDNDDDDDDGEQNYGDIDGSHNVECKDRETGPAEGDEGGSSQDSCQSDTSSLNTPEQILPILKNNVIDSSQDFR